MTDDRFRNDEGGRAVREEYDRLLSAHLPDVERTVVDGTHVFSAGPDGAPTVVLLHGSGGTSLNWATEIPLLAQSHRVHALDLPGEPGGTVVERLPLEPGAHAAWLAGVTDALGAQHAAVIGESLGGWVALDYATEHPSRVRLLGLLVPGGLGPRRTAPLLVAGLLSLLGAPGRRAAMRYFTGWTPSDEPGLERDLAAFSDLTFRAFRPRTDGLPAFADEALSGITAPVTAAFGDRDKMLDGPRAAAHARAVFGDDAVTLLPGAGHLLPDRAERVLSAAGR
ncbi:alpha/beta fold hydrolase [Tsukamurella tyrosinosolvens]|uniref:alpha/beta fold hydrolase n=1 Tax=Tsukamurella tyrosinosolvens TaxID=57704 RepID=UPI002DD45197|nr:alpha/beta fold hydrolase [Tsukamurella tyrosinosolvens]MEC4615880.1 alpha/beta fold hydrolase [Tsukamurella tyrosinosolvens]